MSLYHVNPETGDAGKCSATQGKCPFGNAGEHFTSPEGARAHYEKVQASRPQLTGSHATGEPMTYDFPERNLGLAEKAIEKANRRLEKAGVPERFSYEVEEYMKENKSRFNGLITAEPRIKFTLNTPAVKYEGYQFLAAVEKAEAGFVVKAATGINLYGYTPDNLKCDACGKNMGRQKTYLVQDSKGEMLQVGSSCVKNYFGVEPKGLWALTFDPLKRAEDSDDWGRVSTAHDSAVPTDWVMAYALAVSDGGEKFMSRSIAQEYGGTSTADDVKSAMNSSDQKYQEMIQQEAQKYIDNGEAKKLIEKLKVGDSMNDYSRNLATIAQGEYTRWGHMNILVSGLSTLAREKRAAAKAAHEATWGQVQPGFLAPEGTKLAGTKLRVFKVFHKEVDDPYSYTGGTIDKTQVTFRDADNHEIVWWASKHVDVESGQEVTIKSGKVKRHGSYNGIDQTILERIQLVEEDKPESE